MSEHILAVVIAVGGFLCLGGCLCMVGICTHSNTQLHVTYTVGQASGSPPEADPEDPVDFSSNPKSSSVSVGS